MVSEIRLMFLGRIQEQGKQLPVQLSVIFSGEGLFNSLRRPCKFRECGK